MTFVHVSTVLRQLEFDFMASELACELYVDEVVDGAGNLLEIDSTVSVSALVEVEDSFVPSEKNGVSPPGEAPPQFKGRS